MITERRSGTCPNVLRSITLGVKVARELEARLALDAQDRSTLGSMSIHGTQELEEIQQLFLADKKCQWRRRRGFPNPQQCSDFIQASQHAGLLDSYLSVEGQENEKERESVKLTLEVSLYVTEAPGKPSKSDSQVILSWFFTITAFGDVIGFRARRFKSPYIAWLPAPTKPLPRVQVVGEFP